jgi:SpoIVB peptidase S55
VRFPSAFAVPAIVFLLIGGLSAQTVMPLADVKPGMRGTGKTVFSGSRIEEFQVEVLGVLENIGPKQSLILARLSGGPLATTGVMQGMSGSPVYVDGKLMGAVAMAFPFSKEPVAAIRPIEEMLRTASAGPAPTVRAGITLRDTDLTRVLPKPVEALAGNARLVDIATPISFSGFSRGTLDQFTPQLRALGLEPLQGISGGGRVNGAMGNPSALAPGAMITVQLMSGDLSIGADGTVTHIDGNSVYAFGHRFLSAGSTSLPFARSEVITLLPSLSTSFKISSPKELMGTISQDRNTGISGQLGRRAQMVPVSIGVSRGGRQLDRYRLEMVNDRFLSPMLVQMAIFSAIDSTERTIGASTFMVKGAIEFDNLASPIRLDNMFAGDSGSAMQVSLAAAIPLAYVLQSGFESLQIKNVSLEIESFDQKKQLQIDQVQVGRRQIRPGEKIELTAIFSGENGAEVVRKIDYQAPSKLTPGPLLFTVTDGQSANMADIRLIAATQRSPAQLISTVNQLRGNTKAYVRVWRPETAFQLEGEDFPSPPPSLALILGQDSATQRGAQQTGNSKLAELEIAVGDVVISGSKTVQLEVKE